MSASLASLGYGAYPRCADDYALDAPDHHVNDEFAWKTEYKDDRRPNAGITCNGRYLPDDPFDLKPGHCRRKYHCIQCGLQKVLRVAQRDAHRVITFACPACRQRPPHAPVGMHTRVLGYWLTKLDAESER